MTDETAHDGASGDDTLRGGAGADNFVFDPNHGNDVVADFTDGKDLIDLSAFSTISGFSDLTLTSGRERGHHRPHRARRRNGAALGS